MSASASSASASHHDLVGNLFLEVATVTLTKPQQRWRFLLKAIYSIRALRFPLVKRRNQQRWRLGFTVISFTRRALLSFRIRAAKTQILNRLSHSPSYTAIEIDPTESLPVSSDFNHNTLVAAVKEKKLELIHQLGGIDGVAAALRVDIKKGIHDSTEHITERRVTFGSNTYPKPPAKGFFHFVLERFKETTILFLLLRIAVSLGFGIKQYGLKDGCYDGGSISLAVLLFVLASATIYFKTSRLLDELSEKRNDIKVDVIRDGRRQQISISEVVVGEIVFLSIGNQIPADGLFLDDHSMKVEESSITRDTRPVDINRDQNPFMISGSKLVDGYGRMLVTSVGVNTSWRGMMSSTNSNREKQTPLQTCLGNFTSYVEKSTLFVAFIVLVVKLIKYLCRYIHDEKGTPGRTQLNFLAKALVDIVSTADTIVMVTIPEGLPLVVPLTLVCSLKRIMANHTVFCKPSACEAMSSVTTICAGKTGILTLNQIMVTEFWVGEEAITDGDSKQIEPEVPQLLQEGAALNTTGSDYRSSSGSEPEFSGNPTEKAILEWAELNLGINVNKVKQSCRLLHVKDFDSEKKRSEVLMRENGKMAIRVHCKGGAEIILAICSSYFVRTGTGKPIHQGARMQFEQIIESMAARSLQCIAFAYKPISEEEIRNAVNKLEEDGLTLLGLVGLEGSCQPQVKEAVKACSEAGVNIKMITGDNVFTAKAIAIDCGILGPVEDLNNGAVMEGEEFRNCSGEELLEKAEKIRVMARASPSDKQLMVQCLKERGHVVAVTGNGIDDAAALKEADIGIYMGSQSTQVSKESSDIVILDDNLNSVVTIIKHGRCIYRNVQKIIQFQLTMIVAAIVINFVAAVSSKSSPLTAAQLLWVNLLRDTLGTLALAAEYPTQELLKKPPVDRTEPLVTKVMWRNLIIPASYQVTILLILQYQGAALIGVEERIKDVFIFNTFVLCQVFNVLNARKLEKRNIFGGIHKNPMFIGVVGMALVIQLVMVEFNKGHANKERLTLTWGQWGASVGTAALSWPIGWVIKWIPVLSCKPFFRFLEGY